MVDLGDQPRPGPVGLPPQHVAPPAVKRPPTRRKLGALAAIGIATVLVVSFALSSLGAPRETTSPSQASPTSSAPASPVGAVEALCLHLRDLQTPREDALTRLASTLEDDAAALAADGKRNLADAVDQVRIAVIAYRDALASHGDTSAPAAQLGAAMTQLPC
jgi:hypothetical protein